MGRPGKLTMDFFVHDADASSDRKIRLLSKKHGNDGYATYFRLLEALCHEPGMILSLASPDCGELLAEDFHLRDVQHLYKIIQHCAEIGLIDRQIWESERSIFSHGLYKRYMGRLEDRKSAAQRQRRSREAKSLQSKIDNLDALVTRDNPVTSELSQKCHSTEAEYRITETDPKSKTEPEKEDPNRDCVSNQKTSPSKSKLKGNDAVYATLADLDKFEKCWTWYCKRLSQLPPDKDGRRASPGSKVKAAIAWRDFIEATNSIYEFKKSAPRYDFTQIGIPHFERFIRNGLWQNGTESTVQNDFIEETPVAIAGGVVDWSRYDWSKHPQREAWQREMLEKHQKFYRKADGSIDQEKSAFYRANVDIFEVGSYANSEL